MSVLSNIKNIVRSDSTGSIKDTDGMTYCEDCKGVHTGSYECGGDAGPVGNKLSQKDEKGREGGEDTNDRLSALEEAKEAVGGRDDTHGEPEDNFSQIAQMWSAYLGIEVKPYEVADMMVSLKLCRIASGHPDRDHHVDICGYGTLGADLVDRSDG